MSSLRELPRALAALGYIDALAARGVLDLRAPLAADLDVLPRRTATAIELFYLRRSVEPHRASEALGEQLAADLLALGVLVERGGMVSTMNLVALPMFGRVAFVPSPARLPDAYLGDEVALLLSRMLASERAALVLGAGPGLLALQAGATSSRVLAIEHDPIALACAELNVMMSGSQAVELRAGQMDARLAPAERFDRVFVAAPTTPLPVADTEEARQRCGPAILERVLAQMPELLEDQGLAQLAGVMHGNDSGPTVSNELVALARAAGLAISVTAISRAPLAPGSPVFDAFTAGIAAAGNLNPQAAALAQQRFCTSRGITYLYLVSASASRGPGGVEITRHWSRPGGGWQRRA